MSATEHVTYGPSGFDPDKSGNNVITTTTVPLPADEATRLTIEDRVRTIDMPAADATAATAAFSVTGTTVAEIRSTSQTAIRDLQRQVKDLARANRRLTRLVLRMLDSTE